MAHDDSDKLTSAPNAFTRKQDTARLTADDFVDLGPGTWFEVIPAPETPVKPYFDVDVHTEHDAVPPADAADAAKARCVAFLTEHFPEHTAINCCQRVSPARSPSTSPSAACRRRSPRCCVA